MTTVTHKTKVDRPYAPLPSTFSLPYEPGVSLPRAKYGGRHTVAMLMGDGVSPEMMSHVKAVYHTLEAPVDFDEVLIDNNSDDAAVREAILAVQRNGVAIKGIVNWFCCKNLLGLKSKNIMIRKQLELFAYVQRCYSFPGVVTRHKDIDITVIRENTEGEYSQLEHESVPGVVESMKIITYEKSARIARFAFDYALQHGRKKVTAVHKANIMKLSDGLFLKTCEEVSKLYPSIEFNSMIIDNCCMQLVSRPQQFEVLVLPNLYGNIVGNLCAGLVGGAGLAAGMNLGENYAIFESGTRKQARSLKGQNIANPVSMLLASADLLDHLGEELSASFTYTPLQNVRTPDIGGMYTTKDVVNAVTSSIISQMQD
ncbi:unnamed protein product [Mesocestoides corti]|uniref:Iso_dh domain-containing protein n=1 Tax=Mesocestoides corti TaxID=53468 RepID=A0A0R3U5N6_MESCO|nr:unnamed protein product [Mesocestoides corti]